ncbi:MAG: aspartate--tRNA ligase [Patescibacteria group bacterium]|nr:aspartate--tRNA ligase [Patescibacteria group bacterium]
MKKIFISETLSKIGKKIELFGWVNSVRSHGKLIFFDLRDRSGIIQCVVLKNASAFEKSLKLREEMVIRVRGKIQKRDEKLFNPKILTGEIEVIVEDIQILSEAKTLPIPIDSDGYEINEEIRLKYRYLDLKRERLQKNLVNRHRLILFIRNWLSQRGFIEVETPILTKSTPEGARDYLVPSRLHKGKFYALPQSPQQYKQLLMVSGIERYFQIARCFRDEDPRGDRQPEFTQLDIEMSFIEKEDILKLIEKLFIEIVEKLYPQKKITSIPFPRLTYQEAIEKFKSDKPDLRKNKNDLNELAFCFVVDFPMFEILEDGNLNPMHHPFTQPKLKNDEFNKEIVIDKLRNEPLSLLSEQYDFVCNGYEIGGGSIRTIDKEILIEVFKTLGHKEKDLYQKFGHLLEAFDYGVPPHGGIAPGIDRILMILENEPNIREVIAFPKTGEGRDLMMNSPSEVNDIQLKELGIEIENKN